MRPTRIASIGAAAIALAATAPAAAEAGSWTSARAATSAGQSFDPSVAADSRGRIALGFARHLDGRNRAEIRQGRLRDGVRGASTVIDSLTGNLDDVTVGLRPASPAADIVWRRLARNAQRLYGTSLRAGGTSPPSTRTELTTGPSSGYEPRWVDGADGVRRLVYDLRTTSAERNVTDQGYGPASSLPGTGVASQPGLVVAADGTRTASWQDGGRVLIAQAAPGAAYGAPVTLPTAGYARDVQIVQGADGTVVVAWLASTGQGNAVQLASRPTRRHLRSDGHDRPGPGGRVRPAARRDVGGRVHARVDRDRTDERLRELRGHPAAAAPLGGGRSGRIDQGAHRLRHAGA